MAKQMQKAVWWKHQQAEKQSIRVEAKENQIEHDLNQSDSLIQYI